MAATNIIFWRGTLLAMKEDGPPFAMDPVSLETISRYDFEGQVLSQLSPLIPSLTPTLERWCATDTRLAVMGMTARATLLSTQSMQMARRRRKFGTKPHFAA